LVRKYRICGARVERVQHSRADVRTR